MITLLILKKESTLMGVRSLFALAVLYVLFNLSQLFAADQPLHALSAPLMGQDGAPMVEVPAGSFPMGVPEGDRDGGRDEYPRHDVFVDTFFIDRYEVTNAHYLEFVKATHHRVPQHPKNPTRNLWQGESIAESLTERPVINVDWFDADAYCKWAGKRLPTEAEWEKAAKGTADRRFPWGNVEPTNKHLNFNQPWIGEKTLMPVGSYEAGKSPFGTYDMAGNVWEWVNDWYDARYYEKSPAKNPNGPDTGTKKVIRGAGWQNETPTVRIFTRVDSDPTIRNESTGFRCAADAAMNK
jgi:formylglycine-generating enzyme required for sulfatase activity